MKLVIQIPCYNEEKTLPLVIKEIPKKIQGIGEIIILVIDDGSIDNTEKIAKELGCTVIKNKRNLGLAKSFKKGLEYCLSINADFMINTDGDNQYQGKYIKNIVEELINNKADIVIGDRQTQKIKHFSPLKKILQKFGSFTVSYISNIKIKDTVSGFRGYSREAMYNINITSNFSYVLDSLIQASKKDLLINEIKVKTNPPTRESRLFKNMFEHVIKSGIEISRVYFLYEPFKTFLILSSFFIISGIFLLVRFFYYYILGINGLVQSLIISSLLFGFGFILLAIAIIGDILSKNRKINEEILYYKKKEFFDKK